MGTSAHTLCQVVDCLADHSPTLTSCNIAKLAPKSAAYIVLFSANCAEGTCISAARWFQCSRVFRQSGAMTVVIDYQCVIQLAASVHAIACTLLSKPRLWNFGHLVNDAQMQHACASCDCACSDTTFDESALMLMQRVMCHTECVTPSAQRSTCVCVTRLGSIHTRYESAFCDSYSARELLGPAWPAATFCA